MGLLTLPDGLYDLLVTEHLLATLGTDHADTGVFQGDRVDLLLAGVIRGGQANDDHVALCSCSSS
jgi:hypothetical protein